MRQAFAITMDAMNEKENFVDHQSLISFRGRNGSSGIRGKRGELATRRFLQGKEDCKGKF